MGGLPVRLTARCLAGLATWIVALSACVNETRLTSDSPDGTARVELVDRAGPLAIDRNFLLYAQSPIGSTETVLFLSPDEGPPGTERIVWSRDSRRFVVLGKKFFAYGEPLVGGEQLYLLYDRETGEMWCNAKQRSDLPSFYLDELTDREWTAPIGPVGGPAPAERFQVVVFAPQPRHRIEPGESFTSEVEVDNRGNVADEYRVTVDVWKLACEAEPDRFPLEAGARLRLPVRCELPPELPRGSGGVWTVTVFVEGSNPEITKGWDSFSLVSRRRSGPTF
jgi:hypothetical protein